MPSFENLKSHIETVLEDRLVDGEEILNVTVIHKGIYWQAIAIAIITALVGIFIAYQLMFVLGAAALVSALYAFLRQKLYVLVLTNKRIFARYGLLKMDMVDMRFNTIESMETEQMLPGMIMGYANLVVMGTGNRYITIPYVANAKAIRKTFNQMVLEDKN